MADRARREARCMYRFVTATDLGPASSLKLTIGAPRVHDTLLL